MICILELLLPLLDRTIKRLVQIEVLVLLQLLINMGRIAHKLHHYVIIVESIGDCLSLIEKGFNNVLVSFGLDISSKLLCAIVGFNFKKA